MNQALVTKFPVTDKTREALTAFQQANGLATGGITYETLAALGMIAP